MLPPSNDHRVHSAPELEQRLRDDVVLVSVCDETEVDPVRQVDVREPVARRVV
jgi:hypothetical protein